MPPTGAIFFVAAIFLQMLRLILGEEAYLVAQQGEPYLAYKAARAEALSQSSPSRPGIPGTAAMSSRLFLPRLTR